MVSLLFREVILDCLFYHPEFVCGEGGESEPLEPLHPLLLTQLVYAILKLIVRDVDQYQKSSQCD